MDFDFDKNEELQNTVEDIIQDVILLEAMELRMEQRQSFMGIYPKNCWSRPSTGY